MSLDYISNCIKLFKYYKALGEKTFEQVTDEDLVWKYNPASNSIAQIVRHLHGNMLSRWTDFLDSDGEKSWRQREQEFSEDLLTRSQMQALWEAGWSCVFSALENISESDLKKQVYIRQQAHTIEQAIDRQLAHYAYHIGQIVYLGRMMKDQAWTSLSIARGASEEFNARKSKKGKHAGHFTDDII